MFIHLDEGSALSVAVDGHGLFRRAEKTVEIIEEIAKQLSDTSDNPTIWWSHRTGSLYQLHEII